MIGEKWWLTLLFVWIILVFSFSVLQGHTAGAEMTTLDKIVALKFNFASLSQLPGIFWNIVSWNYGFLNTGIGLYIKPFLLAMTAVVVIPLMFELTRLILKPFGG